MKLDRIRETHANLVRSLASLDGTRGASLEIASAPDEAARAWLSQLTLRDARPASSSEAPARSLVSVLAERAPHRPRLDVAFGRLKGALEAAGQTAGGAEAVEATILSLGYEPRAPKHDRARFKKGSLRLSVTPVGIAEHVALKVSLRDRVAHTKKTGFQIGAVMIPKNLFMPLERRYREEIERFVAARARHQDQNLPIDYEALKSFILGGEKKKEIAERNAHEAEIQAALLVLEKKLEALRAEGRAPSGIVFYVDGPDGAGKTSTGAIVADALEHAGYALRRDRFKAPTAEEREAAKKLGWLHRFERGLPKPGEAVLWDRGPAGDPVYGAADPAKMRAMARDFNAWEKELAKRNILLVKVELYAAPEKQADTFGKRLARQMIADRVKDSLRSIGSADAASLNSLDDIAHKIDGDDIRALATYPQIQRRYRRFTTLTQESSRWLRINATHRHAARLRLIEGTVKAFDAFAARANPR